MEYNKNRFQKTNDKKILHKVKKQWVVLSVALLAALGGGATVATTTHASANANDGNGQNSDQETTIKNRINQNLKLAQSQSANNNASQGQTKQVNVNSLSSNQITKQANQLHNQMLLGATRNTNDATANGRRAQNTEVNRMNENVQSASSAASSVSNPLASAESVHAQEFGVAAPSANFGAMQKPKMMFGNNRELGTTANSDILSKLNPQNLMGLVEAKVKPNSKAANPAYQDLMNLANGINNTAVPMSTWQSKLSQAVGDLKQIKGNGLNNGDFNKVVSNASDLNHRLSNFLNAPHFIDYKDRSENLSDLANDLNAPGTASLVERKLGLTSQQVANYGKAASTVNAIANGNNSNDYHNIINMAKKLPSDTPQQANKDLQSMGESSNNIANNLPQNANGVDLSNVKKDLQQNANNAPKMGKLLSDIDNLRHNSDLDHPASAFSVNNLKSLVNKDVRSGYNPSDTQAASSAYKDLMSLASNEASSIADGKKLGNDTTSAGSQTVIQDLNRAKNDLDTLNRNAKVNSDYSLGSLDSEVDAVANDLESDVSNSGVGSLAASLIAQSANNNYNFNSIAKSLSGKNNKAAAAAKAMQAIEKNSAQRSDYNNIVSNAAQLPNDNSDVKNSATVNDNKRADVSGLNAEYNAYSNISKNMNSLASYFTGSQDGANNVSADSSSVSAIHNYLTSNAQTASSLAKSASAKASGITAQLNAENTGSSRFFAPVHIVYENADGTEQKTYDQQSNGVYVSNSDFDYVNLAGNYNSGAMFTTANASNVGDVSSIASLGTASNNSGVELFTSGYEPTGTVLGGDSGYSLYAINGNTNTKSMNAFINQDGTWTWGSKAASSNSDGQAINNDESMPTIVFRAKSKAGKDINVQYINQNGYKVSAEANNEFNAFSSAANGNIILSSAASNKSNKFSQTNARGRNDAKTSLSGGKYSDDVNYSGANSYGDTINVLNGLDSVSAMSNGSMVYYPATSLVASYIPVNNGHDGSTSSLAVSGVYSYYVYGLQSNESAASSFSDYTYGNKEQTVTLPVHGQNVASNYQKVTINTAVLNHKGKFIPNESASSAYSVQQLASIAGSTGAVHYGDLIKVDPASYAPSADDGKDVANSSDYRVDPYATASDRSQQNIPYIYISQTGPKWISLQNKSDARPMSLVDNGAARLTNNKLSDNTKNQPYKEPTFNDTTTTPNTITFNYTHGAEIGTVSPIHVTYRDQHNNVVSQGLITPTQSNYGDLINIPAGTDITNASGSAMFSNAALPAGYSLDYNQDGSDYNNYQINSDETTSDYTRYSNIGQVNQSSSNVTFGNDGDSADDTNNLNAGTSNPANYVGQDITIHVIGNYTTSTNKLYVHVHHTDKNGHETGVGTIPITIDGYNGDNQTLTASDVEAQAQNSKNYTKWDSSNQTAIPSSDVLTPSDQKFNVHFANNKVYVSYPNDNGQGETAVTSDENGNSTVDFDYRDPNGNVSEHNVHINYFYSDYSDIPNTKTPRAKNGLIPLNETNIIDTVGGDSMNLNPYMKNPPAGYQFVRVLSDSNTMNGLQPGTKASDVNNMKANPNGAVNVNLNSTQTSDTIDIQVIPTAGSITFHYYNQNDEPVEPDSDNEIVSESAGKDFTNGSYGYISNHTDSQNASANNTHTEFGNTPTQYSHDGNTYYSRYGQYFNVSDIPVPRGYHINHNDNQGLNRYYRFNRTHQDVNVMVTGNKDDVANHPSDPLDQTITPGDKGNSDVANSNNKPAYNADTIWVTVHEMDPSNNLIRKYDIPEYISGNTGDQAHLYASDYTPEAQKDQQGKTEYYFTPYAKGTVRDSDLSEDGNNTNYTQGDVSINSDGTATALENNNMIEKIANGGNQNNHFDFYYKIKDFNSDLYPINVTYMDGSKAVGFKQINPTSANYYAQDIKNVINYRNNKTTGDTPDSQQQIPSGYKLVNSDLTSDITNPNANVYSTTFDDNHPQDIVIPVHRTPDTLVSNAYYRVVDNFYEKMSNGYTSFVGNSALSSTAINPAYSGSSYAVNPASDATYNGATYTGSNNSNAQVLVTSDGTTPGVINYNYYSSAASMNPKSNSGNSSSTPVSGTVQPIFVQYFTGNDKSNPTASGDYMIGSDAKLTGQSGSSYANVTNIVPVPAGYYIDPSNQNVTSPAFNDQIHQMDIHVAKDNTSDVNFPVTVILKDAKGSDIDNYTNNVRIQNHNNSGPITATNYNPDSKYFNYDQSDSRNNTNGNTTISDNNGELSPITHAYLVYKLNTSTPSDLGKITVHYIDEQTGKPVNDANNSDGYTISGNYFGQKISDITNINNKSMWPTNYTPVKNQKTTNYYIGNEPQNVDLLVTNGKNTNPNNNHYLTVNVVEVNKDNGNVHYVSDVYYQKITSDMTVDPHNFIPVSDEFNPNYNGKFNNVANSKHHVSSDYNANPSSTSYYMDPADHNQLVAANGKDHSLTFIYDKSYQHNFAGDIVLKYIDEDTGKQVGYTDVINGKGKDDQGNSFNRNGQQINVQQVSADGDSQISHGEATPKGYTLTPSDQRVNYTFTNDEQDVDLFVRGKMHPTTMNIYIHKETQSDPSGDNPKNVSSVTTPVDSPVGSRMSFEPNNYVPAGFHTDPRYVDPQSVTVNPDGTVNGNVNFYYKQDSIAYVKPYIIRYVNQEGQQVGYTDLVDDPNIVKMGQTTDNINLIDPKDGGEPVPKGYVLESGHPFSSNNSSLKIPSDVNNYSDQTAYNYKFGNNHIITLKVTGKPVQVPLTVHLVELSNDNKPNDATHVYANTRQITSDSDGKGGKKSLQVGDSFILNASQYLDSDNAQDPSDSSKHGYYLPNNSDGKNYNVSSDTQANMDQGIDNTAKKVTVMVDGNGNPYLSIDDTQPVDKNGNPSPLTNMNYNDNQAVFYYKPSQNEQAAPIDVFYYNQSDGKVLYKGYINPSDVTNNPPAWNGYQLSDVYNKGNTSHNQLPSDIANYYKRVGGKEPVTFMHNKQTVYVPLQPNSAWQTKFQVKATVMTPSDKPEKSTIIPLNNIKDVEIGTNKTFSPYDYVKQAESYTGIGNLYPSVSDGNYTVSNIQPDQTYTIPFDYQYDTNASTTRLGTINVHYVTKGKNNGQDVKIPSLGSDYYQVDQESDHGFSNNPFHLSDYLNDIPSFKNNYYYLVSDAGSNGVIGFTGISDQTQHNGSYAENANQAANSKPLPTSGGQFNADGFTFQIGNNSNPTNSDTHQIYGMNQDGYVSRASNKTSNTKEYNEALNTQDIYVLVSPDSINDHGFIPNSSTTGNNANSNKGTTSGTSTNPSFDGALPINQAGENGTSEENPSYHFNY